MESAAGEPAAPGDYSFDLDRALSSVVGLHSIIPPDAFSAETLGTERAGNGVLIDDGLVLTIGYLITEAEAVWLHLGDGRVVEGHALGFDFESGFGLVQALGRPRPRSAAARLFGCRARSATASWSAAPAGARARSRARSPPSRNSPAIGNICWTRRSSPIPRIPNWGGTGLISNRGELIGIGSLQLERERDGKAEHVNMIVPIDLLKPVLDDIRKFGRVNKPARPWLGMYTTEIDNRVVVVGIASKGRRRAPSSRPATSSSPSTATRSRARPASTGSSGRSGPPASTCRSRSTTRASPSTWC